MADLSPQAQAVLDAYDNSPRTGFDLSDCKAIAAVLRAAANQLDHATSAHTLYAFADELEGNR